MPVPARLPSGPSVIATPSVVDPCKQMQNKANRRKPVGDVTTLYLFCRGVDLTTPRASGNLSANRDVANEFINELRESKYFDGTMEAPKRIDLDPNGTFTFGMTLKLKRPLKL